MPEERKSPRRGHEEPLALEFTGLQAHVLTRGEVVRIRSGGGGPLVFAEKKKGCSETGAA
jgi:hypothetical protein